MKGSMVLTEEVNVRELKSKSLFSSTTTSNSSPGRSIGTYSNVKTRRSGNGGLSIRERVTSVKGKVAPPKIPSSPQIKETTLSRPSPPIRIVTEEKSLEKDDESSDSEIFQTRSPRNLVNRAPKYEISVTTQNNTLKHLVAKKIEIWLIRHGETEANARRITQGQQPGRLTRLGAQQAACLGARLEREQSVIDAVLSSDLLRCRQTAHLAIRDWFGTEKPFFLDIDLRERSVGTYEGQHHSSPRTRRPQGISPRQFRAPSGESWQDVYERATFLLQRVATTLLDPQSEREVSRILVFTHGGFIAETVNACNRTDEIPGKPLAQNGAMNTAIYKLGVETVRSGNYTTGTPHKALPGRPDHSWTVLAVNDASHLSRFRMTNNSPADFDITDDHPPLPPTASSQPWWSLPPIRTKSPSKV
mmetsp:Transcript_3521/g.4614  ORF Transcript_3521/g.4614 Transcript_3521/m.4614 type:complete len:417 (+) Transcript_3521:107-1357(+)|eukprot:CAMPEP_0197292258 /NCGR_PEP_ID=MMETSP0890-20130614/22151_1 /TAXON_ID=44058 ORGANISM="Aureoumbra lagunensis, Strain CCMP1510" /NCGR_SAMPLE_ID=MMETSP0890 /ASSEMBLY_ACC=CAM_ASM_000533 /LENGTH=416 /DNA_ID=CAMNT_0042766017 /DNA_START=18 /DNA_END=1268 /DNA_ORIENTATION=-